MSGLFGTGLLASLFGGGGGIAGSLGRAGGAMGRAGAMPMAGASDPWADFMRQQQMQQMMGGMGQQQQGPQTAGQLPPMPSHQMPPPPPMRPVGGIPQGGPLIPGMGWGSQMDDGSQGMRGQRRPRF